MKSLLVKIITINGSKRLINPSGIFWNMNVSILSWMEKFYGKLQKLDLKKITSFGKNGACKLTQIALQKSANPIIMSVNHCRLVKSSGIFTNKFSITVFLF